MKTVFHRSKEKCALYGFCFTLICRNATKTAQDPSAKFKGKIWGDLSWCENYVIN